MINNDQLLSAQDMLCLGRLFADRIIEPRFKQIALEMCACPPELNVRETLTKVVQLQLWWDENKVDDFVSWGGIEKFNFSKIKAKYKRDNVLCLFETYSNQELPTEILQLHNIRLLGFRNSILKFTALKNLTCLENLYISNFIPQEISEFTSLKHLGLVENMQYSSPNLLGLSNLRKLDLHANQLKEIPQEILQLVNLVNLIIRKNFIIEFPDQITKLTNLKSLDISNNQIKDISILSQLHLKELDVTENPVQWDANFLQHAETNAIKLMGVESEKCPEWNRINFKLSETCRFDELLKRIEKQIQHIVKNKNVRMHTLEALIMNLSNHLNSEYSIFSIRYEEINQLKDLGFHVIVEYVLASRNSKLIFLTLNTIVPLIEIDNNFLEQIPVERLYSLFSFFFKDEKDTEITDIGLRCLIYLENDFFDSKDSRKKKPVHPLSYLKTVTNESLFWILPVLNVRQSRSLGKDNFSDLKSFFKTIQLYFNSIPVSPSSMYIYKSLIDLNIKSLDLSKCKSHRLYNYKLTPYNLLIDGLTTFESLKDVEQTLIAYSTEINSNDRMASKIWEKLIKNILISGLNSMETYGEATFNFMYRRCYTNTLYIANCDPRLAAGVLRNFCHFLTHPAKTKKCLEVIALILGANPELEILQGWVNEKWALEFLPCFFSRSPKPGEKQAWCGAIALTQSLVHLDFQFPIPFDQILNSNDSLIMPFIHRILENTKINLESMENDLHGQIKNELLNVKRLQLNSEKYFDDYQKKSTLSIENECQKIKFLFKDLSDINLSFLPSSEKINILISSNERVGSARLELHSLFIKSIDRLQALEFALSQSHTQIPISDLKDKPSSEIGFQCKNIFLRFSQEIDLLQDEIKKEIFLQSIEFYNKRFLLPINKSNDLLITKINQCKTIFDTYISQIQHALPEITPENLNLLLESRMPLNSHELDIQRTIHKKMQKELSVFTEKNFSIEESAKIRHLKEKNKELKEKNKILSLKTKELEKLQSSQSIIQEKKENDTEKNDLQIANLIQQDIQNLMLFQALPPRSYWSPQQQKGWTCITHHLKEIETLTQPSSKQFRNWERKDAWRLLELVGFQAKGELDGSHLEIHHPLFNIHESVSFNSQKQTAIRLMKCYFESVHEVLELWYHEITKKMHVPFGQ